MSRRPGTPLHELDSRRLRTEGGAAAAVNPPLSPAVANLAGLNRTGASLDRDIEVGSGLIVGPPAADQATPAE